MATHNLWMCVRDVSLYLAPADNNRLRYLMEHGSQADPKDDVECAKNSAISMALGALSPAWVYSKKGGEVFLGGPNDYRKFDLKKYDPRNDPCYAGCLDPNMECVVFMPEELKQVYFDSEFRYPGTLGQLIVMALRTFAFMTKLQHNDRPAMWLTKDETGVLAPYVLVIGGCPPTDDEPE